MNRDNHFALLSQAFYKRVLLILCLIAFKCILDLGYVHFVSPYFSYMGFYLNISGWKVIESYFLLILMSVILPFRVKQPSEFFIFFLFIFIAIPLLSIYGFKDESREYLYMVLLSFVVLRVVINLPRFRIPVLPKGHLMALLFCLFVLVTLFSWIIVSGGFYFFNLNLLRVYEFRREVAAVVFPGFLSYVSFWYANSINIFLLVYSLWKKHYIAAVIVLLFQVLYFGVSAHKSHLFFPLLIFAAYFFIQRRYVLHAIVLGLIIISSSTLFIHWMYGDSIAASLLIRRVFFVTADNHFAYYHFFAESGFIYMSNSVLSFLFDYPFQYPVPRIISLFQYGHANTWVNTGFLATSFMHFGFIGMLIFSVFVGIIFKLIDSLTIGRMPLWVGVATMIVPMYNLVSADLSTTILTHGLGLSLLFLWLLAGSGAFVKTTLTQNSKEKEVARQRYHHELPQ